MSLDYRADIDGLRAVAVLAIVLFHLGVDSFGGGYVGVDIFFVISGYLITAIIVRELDAGEFSVARFYERRVRRILPALIVVLVFTLAVGAYLLPPEGLERLGESAVATSVFLSNVFFFAGAGYFDGPSELKPLLHTWSLAIEEQFYLLFPWLLFLIHRYRQRLRSQVLIGLTITSFLACVAVTAVSDAAAFFLLPFRAWELLLGSLLALRLVVPLRRSLPRNALAVAGLAMILYSVFHFSPATRFPGAAAALPTVGTALLIYTGAADTTFINRLISARPLVFFGLISYSLYLWHWPIVVYAKRLLVNDFADAEIGILFLLSVLLATLSWKFVEAPFRVRTRLAPRKRLFTVATAVSLLVFAAATGFVVSEGLPQRDALMQVDETATAGPGWQHWKDCEEQGELDHAAPALCDIGAGSGSPAFMLWGDSHALALASAVNLAARERGVAGLIAVRTGCPPLLGVDRDNSRGRTCSTFNDAILRRLRESPEVDTVIVAARWTLAAIGERYKQESGGAVRLVDLAENATNDRGNAAIFERGLTRTFDALQNMGKRIVLVDSVPEIGFEVPSTHYVARLTGRDVNMMIAPDTTEFKTRTRPVAVVLDRVLAGREIVRIEPAAVLCATGRCEVVADGVPLYRDDNHLALKGNLLLVDSFAEVFSGLAADRPQEAL